MPSRARPNIGSREGCVCQSDRYVSAAGQLLAVAAAVHHRLRPGRGSGRVGAGSLASRPRPRLGQQLGLLGRQGTFAEYCAVDQDWLYPSRTMSTIGSAACAAAASAHLGLFECAAAGDETYWCGGSGGVGSMVLQLASRRCACGVRWQRRKAEPAASWGRPGGQLPDAGRGPGSAAVQPRRCGRLLGDFASPISRRLSPS
jgi:hypothetical protein